MKYALMVGLALMTLDVSQAQKEKAVQSGVPAMLEAINGKKARVFLQGIDDGKVTFQPYKSTREIHVGTDKIKSLTFFTKQDQDAVQLSFNQADYAAVIATLDPLMKPFVAYMGIDNNLRNAFCLLMDAHRESGNFKAVRLAARTLQQCGDPELEQRGQVNLALVALAEGDLTTARKLRDEVSSISAGLYLQACIERAEKNPKKAIRTVTKIIVEHANDVDWLAPSEFLCAYLYLDMTGTNSVITTNSALNTARQVKNIYAGSHIGAAAEMLWIRLGGKEIEEAAAQEKAEQEKKEEAERAAKEEGARKKREAVAQAKQDAIQAAQDPLVSEIDVKTTAEMESE